MGIDIKTWLYDILNAINKIDSFFVNTPKDFTVYKNALKTKRAVERNIEIIGEAMNRIMKRNTGVVLTDARKFVDIRNRIIHGYDTVSDEIIWSVVIKHLPILLSEINALLEE